MVNHTVLFKFKETATDEQINAIVEAFDHLKEKVEVIQHIAVRKNFSDRSRGYEWALYSTFKNKEDLKIYGTHPDHVHIIQTQIQPIVEEVVVADIEY